MKHNLSLINLGIVILIAVLAILSSCTSPRSIATMTADELLKKGIEAYDQHKYLKAIEHFQACVYNYPGASSVDTAQYYLALSYFGNDEYEVAQVEFNRLVLNYPASAYFENAIFMRAVCYYESTPKHPELDQTELHTAIRQFEDFIIDFPDSELIPDVQEYLRDARDRLAHKTYSSATVYSRMGAYGSAKIYFQKVIDDFTDSEYAVRALFNMARMEYKQENYERAAEQFRNFAMVYPDHELVAKAREMAENAAYRDARRAFEEDKPDARTKLDAFLETYPASDHADDIRKYLGELATESDRTKTEESVGS